MKSVTQTKFYPEGNCQDACLASILEVPLESLPNYHGADWNEVYDAWLAKRGLRLTRVPIDEDEPAPQGYHIGTVKSPRGDWNHAVVVLDGKVIWDPYPGAEPGDPEILYWDLLVPVDHAVPQADT